MPQPTVGRIVHYQPYDTPTGVVRAAMVTDAYEADVSTLGEGSLRVPFVDLCVFASSGVSFVRQVPFSESPQACHWTWPPRAQETQS